MEIVCQDQCSLPQSALSSPSHGAKGSNPRVHTPFISLAAKNMVHIKGMPLPRVKAKTVNVHPL